MFHKENRILIYSAILLTSLLVITYQEFDLYTPYFVARYGWVVVSILIAEFIMGNVVFQKLRAKGRKDKHNPVNSRSIILKDLLLLMGTQIVIIFLVIALAFLFLSFMLRGLDNIR